MIAVKTSTVISQWSQKTNLFMLSCGWQRREGVRAVRECGRADGAWWHATSKLCVPRVGSVLVVVCRVRCAPPPPAGVCQRLMMSGGDTSVDSGYRIPVDVVIVSADIK